MTFQIYSADHSDMFCLDRISYKSLISHFSGNATAKKKNKIQIQNEKKKSLWEKMTKIPHQKSPVILLIVISFGAVLS